MIHPILTLCSCCSNVVLLEILIREVPGCGNVITFFQFLFIAIEGFIFTSKFGTVKPHIPITINTRSTGKTKQLLPIVELVILTGAVVLVKYISLVLLFFASSVSNNFALNFDISMPLHMIFKSGSLVTNMILGILILKKRYTLRKYFSVFMVSCGIFLTTWASEKVDEVNQHKSSSIIGIMLLSFSLIVSAGLGLYQEHLFKTYGKHSKEALFYSHALPLPGFLFFAGNIFSKIPLFSLSEPVQILAITIPKMWLYLIGNVVLQYVCIRSVYRISASFSSLTVTMILTFRKFLSLMFSVLYFKNHFTFYHWLGAFLVFSGSLLFTDFKRAKTKDQ